MGLGILELLLITALVVVLFGFGTGKLTRAVGDLARGVKTFRAEMKDEPEAPPPPPPVLPRALPAPGTGDDSKART